MLFHQALIYASIYAAHVVNGRIVDQGEQQQQLHSLDRPFTIGVQTEASVTRPAEIAKIEAVIRTSGITEDETLQEAVLATERVKLVLSHWSAQAEEPVKKWTGSRIHMQPQSEDSEMRGMYDKDAIDDAPAHRYRATASYSIDFHQLDRIKEFAMNLTSSAKKLTISSEVKIDWVDWELTEETAAEAKAELRAKAINKAMKDGEEYAAIFHTTIGKPLEFQEQYMYTDMIHRRGNYFWDRDDVDLEPQEVGMNTGVSCKFSTGI